MKVYLSPNFRAVVRPVFNLHRSMASRLPTATIAFFLAAAVALVLSNTKRHFFIGGYSG